MKETSPFQSNYWTGKPQAAYTTSQQMPSGDPAGRISFRRRKYKSIWNVSHEFRVFFKAKSVKPWSH